MKFDTLMKAMLKFALEHKDGRIACYNTKDTARCNESKAVGMAEFRGGSWFRLGACPESIGKKLADPSSGLEVMPCGT